MAQRSNPDEYFRVAQGFVSPNPYYAPQPPAPYPDNTPLLIIGLVLGVGLLALIAYLASRR